MIIIANKAREMMVKRILDISKGIQEAVEYSCCMLLAYMREIDLPSRMWKRSFLM
jgi:hypothetical protein